MTGNASMVSLFLIAANAICMITGSQPGTSENVHDFRACLQDCDTYFAACMAQADTRVLAKICETNLWYCKPHCVGWGRK